MKIKTVLDPVLHKKARPVREDEFGPQLEAYMRQMLVVMHRANGVGLAAPQVSDSRRILVMQPNKAYLMVNPIITSKSEATAARREGCLSVPGKDLSVTRPESVTVEWQDPQGQAHKEVFTGWAATVVQHEIDHLNGVTLVEKMGKFTRSRYMKKLKKRK